MSICLDCYCAEERGQTGTAEKKEDTLAFSWVTFRFLQFSGVHLKVAVSFSLLITRVSQQNKENNQVRVFTGNKVDGVWAHQRHVQKNQPSTRVCVCEGFWSLLRRHRLLFPLWLIIEVVTSHFLVGYYLKIFKVSLWDMTDHRSTKPFHPPVSLFPMNTTLSVFSTWFFFFLAFFSPRASLSSLTHIVCLQAPLSTAMSPRDTIDHPFLFLQADFKTGPKPSSSFLSWSDNGLIHEDAGPTGGDRSVQLCHDRPHVIVSRVNPLPFP